MSELTDMIENVDQEVGIITLVTGTTEDGYEFWAYLSIPPTRYHCFQEAQAAGTYIMTDYGDVLRSGIGLEPPDDVVQEMIEEFGIDPDLEDRAQEMLEELGITPQSDK